MTSAAAALAACDEPFEIEQLVIDSTTAKNYIAQGNSHSVFKLADPDFSDILLRVPKKLLKGDTMFGGTADTGGEALKTALMECSALTPPSPFYYGEGIGQHLLEFCAKDTSLDIQFIRREAGVNIDTAKASYLAQHGDTSASKKAFVDSLMPHLEPFMEHIGRIATHYEGVIDMNLKNVLFDEKHGMCAVDIFHPDHPAHSNKHKTAKQRSTSALESLTNKMVSLLGADEEGYAHREEMRPKIEAIAKTVLEKVADGTLPQLEKTGFATINSNHAVRCDASVHRLRTALNNIQHDAGIAR